MSTIIILGVAMFSVCKVVVKSGGGTINPTEGSAALRARGPARAAACPAGSGQAGRADRGHAEIFGVRKWKCHVRSNDGVATFIKGSSGPPRGRGSSPSAPAATSRSSARRTWPSTRDAIIEDQYRDEWDKYNLWRYVSTVTETVTRAYSMANYPEEYGIIMLNVRIATPPRQVPVPPGIMSSFIFGRKPGDEVTISGPFGDFFARDTKSEMVYIGGGAGMAPMRAHLSHLFETLKTPRKVSFWYGARSIRGPSSRTSTPSAQEFPTSAGTSPSRAAKPEDNWTGYKGFIHQVLIRATSRTTRPRRLRVLHLRPANDERRRHQDAPSTSASSPRTS
ncbi:FAD-binding oxidoreductase [Nannocystis sp.]|uniref:FAD-binding oxidoreductase n=1 Tax=Nannocystis sp. TaxID=1962667 RepID=UPI0025FEB8DD|nr:FAD-binding oxidoreductase [Nannocystis sp.]